MRPKTCSSTFATPYDIYFQIQMTMNSAEQHPQIRIINIFCPIHWAYVDLIKEVKVWARIYKTFVKYYFNVFSLLHDGLLLLTTISQFENEVKCINTSICFHSMPFTLLSHT